MTAKDVGIDRLDGLGHFLLGFQATGKKLQRGGNQPSWKDRVKKAMVL